MAEEAKVVTWVIRMAKIGYGRTQRELRQTVKKILDDGGRSTPFKENLPGKRWMRNFQHRHPEIAMRTPQLLGKERAILSIEKVSTWYNELEEFLASEDASSILTEPGRMFNCDESGFVLGGGRVQKILAKRGERIVTAVGNSDRRQVTMLANMASDGTYLPPLFVLPGMRLGAEVAEGAPEGSFVGRSPSGWMNSEVFFCYIANCLLPFIQQMGSPFPVLLLVDGYKSHLSLEVAQFCKDNNVILYCFPPHASHVLQPCDLTLFKSLKGKWAATERRHRIDNGGVHVTKQTFARVFAEVWRETTSDPKIARSGFAAAGLFPFTKKCMTDKLLPATVFVRAPATEPASSYEEPATEDEGPAPAQPDRPAPAKPDRPAPALPDRPAPALPDRPAPAQPDRPTPALPIPGPSTSTGGMKRTSFVSPSFNNHRPSSKEEEGSVSTCHSDQSICNPFEREETR